VSFIHEIKGALQVIPPVVLKDSLVGWKEMLKREKKNARWINVYIKGETINGLQCSSD